MGAGDVGMVIGGDQGGSIRIPSSWCGVVGLKPTFGLVPYTGAVPIEITMDHLGPMTRTVTDVALLVEVSITGFDKSSRLVGYPDTSRLAPVSSDKIFFL